MQKEKFILTKCKVGKGSVLIEYKHADHPNNLMTSSCMEPAHPDLTKTMSLLSPYVAKTRHLDAVNELSKWIESEVGKKEYSGILAKAKSMQDEILQSIDVRSISLKGDEDKRSVIITSVVTKKGQPAVVNTPKINLNGDVWGVEEAITESVDEIISEAWEYLFNGKRSQLEMDFDGQQDADFDEEEGED